MGTEAYLHSRYIINNWHDITIRWQLGILTLHLIQLLNDNIYENEDQLAKRSKSISFYFFIVLIEKEQNSNGTKW